MFLQFLFTKKKKAQTLVRVLKNYCEKSLMRNIKASQLPPPPQTHSIIIHF